MSIIKDATTETEDTQAQIARLRDQLDALASEAAPALRSFAEKAGAAVTSATGITGAQAKAAIGEVTAVQIGAVVVAAGFGWLVGRLMR